MFGVQPQLSGSQLCACLLAIVTLAAYPTCVAAQETLEERLATGDSLYAIFENEAALGVYQQAWESDSTHFGLLYRLARTANDVGQDLLATVSGSEAEPVMRLSTAYANALSRHYPDHPESWFMMAATWGNYALFAGGREKVRMGREIETWALKALEMDPDYAYAKLALGIFYREIGDLNWFQRTFANTLFGGLPDGGNEKAMRFLQSALEEDPTLVMTHFELAETWKMMGNPERARYHYGRVVDLRPINTEELRQQQAARKYLMAE